MINVTEKRMCNLIKECIMNKKIFYGIAVCIVAAIAAWNVNLSSKTKGMSDVSLANVEALASETIHISCSIYPYPVVCWWLNDTPMPSGYGTMY